MTRSPEVAELACKAGVKTVLHSLPGRNDTVRLGLEALLEQCPGLAGCIFLPGDQPLLQRETLEALRSRAPACASSGAATAGPSSSCHFPPEEPCLRSAS